MLEVTHQAFTRIPYQIDDGIRMVLALQTNQTSPGPSSPSPMILAPGDPVRPPPDNADYRP